MASKRAKLWMIFLFVCQFIFLASSEPILFQNQLKSADCDFDQTLCNWAIASGHEHNFVLQGQKSVEIIQKKLEPILIKYEFNLQLQLDQDYCFTLKYVSLDPYQKGRNVKLEILSTDKEGKSIVIESLAEQTQEFLRTKPNKYRVSISSNKRDVFIQGLQLTVSLGWVQFVSISNEVGSCPISDVCSFEHGINCHPGLNSQDFSQNFKIYPVQGDKKYELDARNGHWLALSDENISGKHEFQVKVPEHLENEVNICFHFEMNRLPFNRDSINILKRSLEKNSNDKLLWTGNQVEWNFRWNKVSITSSSQDWIVIQIVREENEHADESIKLDNFRLEGGKCPSPADCDFTNGDWCDYQLRSTDLLSTVGNPTVVRKPIGELHSELFKNQNSAAFLDFSGLSQLDNLHSFLLYQLEMVSPILAPTNSSSLKLKFALSKPITLESVFFRIFLSEPFRFQLLFESNQTTNGFQQLCLNLPYAGQFRILIEMGAEPGHETPFVAVTDIQHIKGQMCDDSFAVMDSNLIADNVEKTNLDEISCNFFANACKWKADKDFKFGISKENKKDSFPYSDIMGANLEHTGLIYIKSSAEEKKVTFESPLIQPGQKVGQEFCLHFASFMSEIDHKSAINVYVGNEINSISIIYEIHSQRFRKNAWRWEEVSFIRTNAFKIFIEIEMFKTFPDMVAGVQRLTVRNGNCDETIHLNDLVQKVPSFCDFESSECLYHSMVEDEIPFVHTIPGMSYVKDHTHLLQQGHTMSVIVNHKSKQNASSHLIKRLHPTMDGYCVRLWIQHNITGRFQILNKNNDPESKPFLTVDGPLANDTWFPFQTDIPKFDSSIDLIFEINYSKESEGTFSIDDIEIEPGSCSSIINCDFETNCMWENVIKSGYSYIDSDKNIVPLKPFRMWSMTNTMSRVPDHDHSLSSIYGHFLYYIYDVSAPKPSSIFKSPIFDTRVKGRKAEKLCFSYYQKQPSFENQLIWTPTNDLKILIGTLQSKQLISVQSKPKSTHSNANFYGWIEKKVEISLLETVGIDQDKIVLYFIADPNEKFLTDKHIGYYLDDFKLEHGGCDDSLLRTFECNDRFKTRLFKEQVCDHIVDCLNGVDEAHCLKCEFNHNFCKYLNEKHTRGFKSHVSTNEWTFANHLTRHSSSSSSNVHHIELNRTSLVHLSTAGHVNQQKLQENWLISPTIHKTFSSCQIQIDYLDQKSNFEIRLSRISDYPYMIEKTNENWITIWKPKVNENDDKWTSEIIDLGRMDQKFQLILSEEISTDEPTALAIGGIFPIHCGPVSTELNSKSQEKHFKCEDEGWIREDKFCDLTRDCVDGSDEFECDHDLNRCEFQSNLCGWDVDSDNPLETGFQLSQGKNQLSEGPTRDHTHNWKNGGYLILEYDRHELDVVRAAISGGEIYANSECRIRFYCMTNGGNLYLHLNGFKQNEEIKLEVKIVSDYNWNRVETSLLAPNSDLYRISLIGQVDTMNSFLAIDDITFTRGCYLKDLGEKSLSTKNNSTQQPATGYRLKTLLVLVLICLIVSLIGSLYYKRNEIKNYFGHKSTRERTLSKVLFAVNTSENYF